MAPYCPVECYDGHDFKKAHFAVQKPTHHIQVRYQLESTITCMALIGRSDRVAMVFDACLIAAMESVVWMQIDSVVDGHLVNS